MSKQLMKGPGLGTSEWREDFVLTDTDANTRVFRVQKDNGSFTSGTAFGLETRPVAHVGGTQGVVGAQFSPRNDPGLTLASLVGCQAAPLLKNTTTTLTGDFTGFEADLTDSQASGNTIGGDIVGFRCYLNMASQTVTGDVVPLRVDAAGSTLQFTHALKLPDDSEIAKSTQTAATQAGWIKVKVGSATKFIPLYNSVS